MLRIITDFDGPIIDVSERYYQVYQVCLQETKRSNQVVQQLSKAEFWQLKRRQVPEKKIAIISGLEEEQAHEFAHLRRKIIHTEPYFEYDCLAVNAVESLFKIQQAGFDLVVMTMRRVRELNYAFNKYDLGKFFHANRCYCLSNDYVKTRDIDDKPLLMKRALEELPSAADTWMVGDTEADIAAAKNYGIKMIALECGIREHKQLELYQPDLIVKDLSQAVNLILESRL